MHFNIILCLWAHLDPCSLFWTHFRGAAAEQRFSSPQKITNYQKKDRENKISRVSHNVGDLQLITSQGLVTILFIPRLL
jgi:hypothetical protein